MGMVELSHAYVDARCFIHYACLIPSMPACYVVLLECGTHEGGTLSALKVPVCTCMYVCVSGSHPNGFCSDLVCVCEG